MRFPVRKMQGATLLFRLRDKTRKENEMEAIAGIVAMLMLFVCHRLLYTYDYIREDVVLFIVKLTLV